jgi:hypothetical protein
MILRETLLLQNREAGMVFSTGLASWARLVVLVIAVAAFILTLSSSMAYETGFRIAVIVLAVFLCVVVGPRSEAMLIRSERRLKITKRFFIFSRTKEFNLDGSEELTISGACIFLNKGGISLQLARSRKEEQRAAWADAIAECLERMRNLSL